MLVVFCLLSYCEEEGCLHYVIIFYILGLIDVSLQKANGYQNRFDMTGVSTQDMADLVVTDRNYELEPEETADAEEANEETEEIDETEKINETNEELEETNKEAEEADETEEEKNEETNQQKEELNNTEAAEEVNGKAEEDFEDGIKQDEEPYQVEEKAVETTVIDKETSLELQEDIKEAHALGGHESNSNEEKVVEDALDLQVGEEKKDATEITPHKTVPETIDEKNEDGGPPEETNVGERNKELKESDSNGPEQQEGEPKKDGSQRYLCFFVAIEFHE